MSTPTGGTDRSTEEQVCSSVAWDVTREYRRVLVRLVARARQLGSRNPEDAAQESLKRSMENPDSQKAIAYYFGELPPAGAREPEWRLDQLFAWLHGVLYNVVREEHKRASTRLETPAGWTGSEFGENPIMDLPDSAPGQLDILIQREAEKIVEDCFPKLEHEYQTVLRMRRAGLKYGEIALQLGVNEDTVATRVARAIRKLTNIVRLRTERAVGREYLSAEGIPHDQ